MAPFLTVSREGVVDLPAPWDPVKVIEDYIDDPRAREELAIPAEDLSTLAREGMLIRNDTQHRWMGEMGGQLRVAVLTPTQLDLEIDVSVAPAWWLRLFMVFFRGRLRRVVDAQIDRLIDDLEAPPEPDIASDAEQEVDDGSKPEAERAPPTSVRTTLEILTLDGRPVYERVEGSF